MDNCRVEVEYSSGTIVSIDTLAIEDAFDVTTIQRQLSSLSVMTFDEIAADVDADESVTILDATFIQRHLAKIDQPYAIGEPMI